VCSSDLVRQDVKLLDEHVVPTAIKGTLVDVARKHNLNPGDVDWYLPHYSSDYFRDKIFQCMVEAGFSIPYEKWFTNLYEVGNIGSASMYLLMEGLLRSGRLRHGDTVLCFIPESGRFSHCFMLLTAVDGDL
jgi:3-oxoacyl-[acyl-carrier-protein] synthase-3